MDRISKSQFSRRQFMQTAAAVGAGAALSSALSAQPAVPAPPASKPVQQLNIAIIGAGTQGRNLMDKCLKIAGIRFIAVCDIWPYAQKYASGILGKYGQPVQVYANYQEMLEKEKTLDAVIVASPDFVHADHSNACLKAGKHVYCEKEMANTLEGAKSMVLTARETKKLLQIGHQRRSNPRYHHTLKMIEKENILGRPTHAYGQWNRSRRLDLTWVKDVEIDAATLKKYGYENMDQFRNWRWYRHLGGGAMADLGSHQIDIFNWFLRTTPRSVMASGGLDYYKDREWYDNVMAIYEYPTAQGLVRAFYQVLNTTSWGGFYEVFMGDGGCIEISEDTKRGLFFREPEAKRNAWEDMSEKIEKMDKQAITLKIGETLDPSGKKSPEGQKLLAESQKPPHQLHLENFFSAIREGTPLSCPAEIGYETAVTILKANEAVALGKRFEFKAEDFKV